MEKKKTTKAIKIGNPHMSQLLFGVFFISLFLLCSYIFTLTNTRVPTTSIYLEGPKTNSPLNSAYTDIIALKDHWILIPNMTQRDMDAKLKLKDYIKYRPYCENVSINTLGTRNPGPDAVWQNTKSDKTPQYFPNKINGMNITTCAYAMNLVLSPKINTVYLDLGRVNGHAFVYCNGYFVGNLGDSNEYSLSPSFTGGYKTLALHNTSTTMELIIVLYSSDKSSSTGLTTTPVLLSEEANLHMSSMPMALLAIIFTFTILALAGGYVLSRTFRDPRTYYCFSVLAISITGYLMVNCNYLTFSTPYKMLLEFLFMITTAAFAYAFIAYLYGSDGDSRPAHNDVVIVASVGCALLMLGFLDSRLLSTPFHRLTLLLYMLVLSILNIFKVIIKYPDAKNATLGICSSISFLFIFMDMVKPKDILANTPLYTIYFLISIFALVIYFLYKYIVQFYELYNTTRHLQNIVEEKTAHISMINRDLYNTNKKLLENEEARKNVMSNVSHDLRTPITAIRGYSELLLQNGSFLNEEQKNLYLQNIVKRSTQMERIVSDIVEITKMESSGFEFEFMDVSMTELLDELYMLYSSDVRNTEKKIEIELPDDDLLIAKADPKRISRVFENIISNAINYSKEEALIRIKAWRSDSDGAFEDQRIHITIADNGIGIPEAELPHIFDRFYRAKNSGQNIKGTGLGLSIVKMIVDKHEAEIKVDSVLGEGTTFHIIMKPTY